MALKHGSSAVLNGSAKSILDGASARRPEGSLRPVSYGGVHRAQGRVVFTMVAIVMLGSTLASIVLAPAREGEASDRVFASEARGDVRIASTRAEARGAPPTTFTDTDPPIAPR